jgi:diguanylate cyclase (GGDEF)-like protein
MPDLTRLQRHLDVLSEVARITSASLSLDDVLQKVMAAVSRLFAPQDWSILLRDDATQGLRFCLALGQAAEHLKNLHLAPNEGIAGWVLMNDRAAVIPDVGCDPRFQKRFDEMTGFQTRSMIALPMRSRGRVIGVMELCNVLEGDRVSSADVDFLQLLCEYAGVAVDNARTHAQVLEMSRRDPLSQLLNSTAFLQELNEEVKRGAPFSVLFFDIDDFKRVVDTHGHLTGSSVLAEIGGRLRSRLAPGDRGSRFGGDEFCALLMGKDRAAASAWAESLRAALRAPGYQREQGKNIAITASIGIASFPADGQNGEELLKAADTAMYRVKGSGKDASAAAQV